MLPEISSPFYLPDLDQVLFPIPGVLNFSATVTGTRDKPSLAVDVQMLSDADATSLLERALQSVPGIHNFDVTVHSYFNPNETGSLQKRLIADQRTI